MLSIALLLACAGSPTPPAVSPDGAPPPEPAPAPADIPQPPPPPPPEVEPDEAPPVGEGAAGAACLQGADCRSGVCEGEGCDEGSPGTCIDAGMRACTRDLRPYCGCDGETFMTSGTCPGRRFAHRGPCE